MDRRRFVRAAGLASAGLLAACARLPGQAPARVPRLGELWPFAPDARTRDIEALRQGLSELGYVGGQNLVIETRYANNQDDRLPGLATELVRLPVDVMLTIGTPAVLAAKQATSTLPIVFVQVGQPVETGLVGSLSQPGGNVTGLTNIASDLDAKRLQLLQETVPTLQRVAVLLHPRSAPARLGLANLQQAAPTFGLQLQVLEVFRAEDFAPAFAAAASEGADGVILIEDWLLAAHQALAGELAARSRLPTIGVQPPFVAAGGLMAYGADVQAQFRRAATYVDKILKGAKPAQLPVEQAREFALIVNLTTVRALGLTIPERVLVQVTEVIE